MAEKCTANLKPFPEFQEFVEPHEIHELQLFTADSNELQGFLQRATLCSSPKAGLLHLD